LKGISAPFPCLRKKGSIGRSSRDFHPVVIFDNIACTFSSAVKVKDADVDAVVSDQISMRFRDTEGQRGERNQPASQAEFWVEFGRNLQIDRWRQSLWLTPSAKTKRVDSGLQFAVSGRWNRRGQRAGRP